MTEQTRHPTVFGKYLLLERLNVGGMAEVFIAKAFGIEGFQRLLAIKRILPTMAEDEEFIGMFIDEARISVELNHANIVHIHELGKTQNTFFIAMEYVSGKDLRTLVELHRRQGNPMPIQQAAFIASKVCEGLDYAHRRHDRRGEPLGIIHRDITPQNILISYDGEVKIIDFGIAKAANRNQQTQAGILKGKFAYMSPEQVLGHPVDGRSDLFAAGVMLYEMLTGERLFVGESDFSTLERVRTAVIPPVTQFNGQVPAQLEAVVMRALSRDPGARYQTGAEFQEDLMRFVVQPERVFSGRHLAEYMKASFPEDLRREQERLARFDAIERPPSIEDSGVVEVPSNGGLPWVNEDTVMSASSEKTQVVAASTLEAVPIASRDSLSDLDLTPPTGAQVVIGDKPIDGATVVRARPAALDESAPAVPQEPTRILPAPPPPAVTRKAPPPPPSRPLGRSADIKPGGVVAGASVVPVLKRVPWWLPLWNVLRTVEWAKWARNPRVLIAAGAVLVSLAVGLGVSMRAASRPGRVQVATTPSDGVNILIGGRSVRSGETVELPPGEYEVVVQAEGYRSVRLPLRVEAGRRAEAVNIQLESAGASPANAVVPPVDAEAQVVDDPASADPTKDGGGSRP